MFNCLGFNHWSFAEDIEDYPERSSKQDQLLGPAIIFRGNKCKRIPNILIGNSGFLIDNLYQIDIRHEACRKDMLNRIRRKLLAGIS